MTEDEFTTMWLKKSGMTSWEAHHYGWVVVPCDCGEDICQGWGTAQAALLDEEELNVLPEPYQTRARELREPARMALGLKARP